MSWIRPPFPVVTLTGQIVLEGVCGTPDAGRVVVRRDGESVPSAEEYCIPTDARAAACYFADGSPGYGAAVNDYPAWTAPGIWYAPAWNAYVKCASLPVGVDPVEYWDPDADGGSGAWAGDAFYRADSLPGDGATVRFTPRGSLREGGRTDPPGTTGAVTVAFGVAGEYSSTLLGDYSGGSSVGDPRWSVNRNGDAGQMLPATVTRRPLPLGGRADYGPGLPWNAAANGGSGAWVRGVLHSASGWFELRAALVPGSGGTFVFCYDTPSDPPEDWEPPPGEDAAISWQGRVDAGFETEAVTGDFSRWI